MVRFLKWLLAAAAVVVLGVAGAYGVSRAMGPSELEREALALIDASPAPPARDGFAALYTAAHDVPEAAQANLLEEDVRRLAAAPLSADGASDWSSLLQERRSLVDARADDPAWCNLRATCLATVRSARDAYAGLLERHARLLDRAEALQGYDGFPNPFPSRLDTPIPSYQVLFRLTTRTAWRFAQGQVDQALADACSDVAMGRRMIDAGDSLIGSMVAAALVQGNAQLLAQMLAELPRDHPLPGQCHHAFERSPALDQGVCRTMLSEGRFMAGGLRSQGGSAASAAGVAGEVPSWMAGALFDREKSAARVAPTFAWYCGDEVRQLLAQDKPLRAPPLPPSRRSLACLSNPVGCILADIAHPAYGDYGMRLQDTDARLRTMRTLLWLRDQAGPVDASTLGRVPAALRSEARPFRLDPQAGTLATPVYSAAGRDTGGSWSVPLPASRFQAAASSP